MGSGQLEAARQFLVNNADGVVLAGEGGKGPTVPREGTQVRLCIATMNKFIIGVDTFQGFKFIYAIEYV